MSAEEIMRKALGQSFTHYVGKDKQLIDRTESELRGTDPKKPVEVKTESFGDKLRRLEDLRNKNYLAGKYSFQRVLDICCAVYGVSEEELLSSSRKNRLVRVRQQVIRICRDRRGLSFLEIGRRLNRDHSTIMHCYKSAQNNPKALEYEYQEILDRLDAYGN